MKGRIQVLIMVFCFITAQAQTSKPAAAMFTKSSNTTMPRVTVYPNPVSNDLNIEMPELRQDITIEIKNLIGKTVYKGIANGESSGSNIYRVDMSQMPAGVYFYNIIDNEGSLVSNGRFLKR